MSQREIAHENLAHKIFVGKENYEGYKDGDVLAIAYKSINHGTLHNFYTLGSVVSCAIQRCSCPFEAVERAKENGEELHFAFGNGVSITSHTRDQEISFMVKHGDEIKFHGKMFEIVATANNNIGLKPV